MQDKSWKIILAGLTIGAIVSCADDATKLEEAPSGEIEVREESGTTTGADNDTDDDTGDTDDTDDTDDTGIDNDINTPTDVCGPFQGYSDEFSCLPPGELINGSRTNVVGITAPTHILSDMRFPVKNTPAFVNSIYFRYNNSTTYDPNWKGPDGTKLGTHLQGDCDQRNYQFPWQDNMCEQRSLSGTSSFDCSSHKGLDIRGPVCSTNNVTNEVVSPINGWIVNVQPHFISILDESENFYVNLMHMDMSTLTYGQGSLDGAPGGIQVRKGQVLGRMGKVQRGDWPNTITTYTPVHLHMELRIAVVDAQTGAVASNGTPVSAYASLIDAYKRLEAGTP